MKFCKNVEIPQQRTNSAALLIIPQPLKNGHNYISIFAYSFRKKSTTSKLFKAFNTHTINMIKTSVKTKYPAINKYGTTHVHAVQLFVHQQCCTQFLPHLYIKSYCCIWYTTPAVKIQT